jgi:hypothetical protein
MSGREAILRSLDAVHPRMLREPVLFGDTNNRATTPLTRAEVRALIQRLETDGLVLGLRDALSEEIQWRITDIGRAALAEKQ